MSDKTKKTKECNIDKQQFTNDYNIDLLNSVDILKQCVLTSIDNIAKDIRYNLVGIDSFSITINTNTYNMATDTSMCYLRLETDLEYESRVQFETKNDRNAFIGLKLQAKRLGYRLEKINE